MTRQPSRHGLGGRQREAQTERYRQTDGRTDRQIETANGETDRNTPSPGERDRQR